MELGLTIPHTGPLASPSFIRDVVQGAEDLAYGSAWAIDHVVLPARFESLYTLGAKPARLAEGSLSRSLAPNYECMSTLLWVAGMTKRIKLGTGVAILPLRNALLNARTVASLDIFSGGRVLYGVGVGWLKEEADAMGMPWDHRGARSEEHIALLRHLWGADTPTTSFHGTYFAFDDIDPQPRPERAVVPILIGGHSDIAIERAGRIGDGWIATSMSPARLSEHLDKLKASAEAAGRDGDELIIVNSTKIPLGSSPAEPLAEPIAELITRLRAYQRLGVDQLRMTIETSSSPLHMAALHVIGREVIPALQ